MQNKAKEKIYKRIYGAEQLMDEVDRTAPSIPSCMQTGERVEEIVTEGASIFQRSFKSFGYHFFGFDRSTLNQNDEKLLKRLHQDSLEALVGSIGGNRSITHKSTYQCKLLSKRPTEKEPLSQGYYLFCEIEGSISEQIFVTVYHQNPYPSETFNLSATNPPENIRLLLKDLSFPNRGSLAKEVSLHPDLMQWIASFSKYNTTIIHPLYIFLKEETTEKFCKYLSVEARKPQKKYRPLMREKGWWASTGAFFGNIAARAWYVGSEPPREYGYDTVIDHPDTERPIKRIGEIYFLFQHLSERFIQNHIGEISSATRVFYEQDNQNGVMLK